MTLKSTRKSIKKVTNKISNTASRVSKSVFRQVSNALKKKDKSVTVSKKKSETSKTKVVATSKNGKPEIKKVKNILVTQPKPENDKNPYTDLANKYKLNITFKPFINMEGISTREFRRYRVNPVEYEAVIFTSRNSIDQFFKLCEELKVKMPQEARFYCMTEGVALYLQKYILYRKRKVFYGDGTMPGLYREITHHRDNEKYLLPCADIHKPDIADFLKAQGYEYAEVVILKTVPAQLKKVDLEYDMIVFFTPAGVSSLRHNFPKFKQRDMLIGAFGTQTAQAVADAGLRLDLNAPIPESTSMSMAIDRYIAASKKR